MALLSVRSGTATRFARTGAVFVVAGVMMWLSVRYLASTFSWRAAAQRVAGVDPLLFFGGGGSAMLGFAVLRTLRWRSLLGSAAHNISFGRLYTVNVVAIAVANFTPAQSGELVKVELLNRLFLVRRWQGATSFLVERTLDLLVVLVFAAIGVSMHPFAMPQLGSVQIASAAMVTVLALIVAFPLFRWLAARLPVRQTPAMLLWMLALTTAAWLSIAAGWWAIAASVGVRPGFLDMIGLTGIATLGGVLSLLPGGLGVTDALISVWLRRSGFGAADAQAVALAIRAFGFVWIPLGLAHLILGLARYLGARSTPIRR